MIGIRSFLKKTGNQVLPSGSFTTINELSKEVAKNQKFAFEATIFFSVSNNEEIDVLCRLTNNTDNNGKYCVIGENNETGVIASESMDTDIQNLVIVNKPNNCLIVKGIVSSYTKEEQALPVIIEFAIRPTLTADFTILSASFAEYLAF